MDIRSATPGDAEAICAIYNPFILDSSITFEEIPLQPMEMERRIEEVMSSLPWLVCHEGNAILGYAYATPWRTRSAYRFSAESTVYVSPDHIRKGIGSLLYQRLISDLRGLGLHCVIGGIALPNHASIALHEILGFKQVAEFKEVGRKFDRWISVGYWELVL